MFFVCVCNGGFNIVRVLALVQFDLTIDIFRIHMN